MATPNPPPLTTPFLGSNGAPSLQWARWLSALQTGSSSGAGATYGPFSGRPAAGKSGSLFVASDAPVGIWVDTGATWRPLLLGQVAGTQPKGSANFHGFNQGSVTLTDHNGALRYSYPTDGSSTTVRGFIESLPSPTMHVEAVMASPNVALGTTNFPGNGVIMVESGTNKFISLTTVVYGGTTEAGVFPLEVGIWASATSRTSFQVFPIQGGQNGPLFLRLARSGTNVNPQISRDGVFWNNVGPAIAVASAYTSAPDSVGFCGVEWDMIDSVYFDVLHYVSGT